MPAVQNKALFIGGILSLLASVLHVGVIIGGPDWYRFLGAGEEMAKMAEQGLLYPVVITAGIAGVLAGWAAYAFSGAGLIRRLPFMRFCLTAISIVYLARAIFGLVAVMLLDNPYMQELRSQITFMIVSSLIVLVYGLAYAVGTAQIWPDLQPKTEDD